MDLLKDAFLVAFVASAVAAFALFVHHAYSSIPQRGIPSAVGYIPVLGAGVAMGQHGVDYLLQLCRSYGAAVRVLAAGTSRIFLLDPRAFKQVWTNPHDYSLRTVVAMIASRVSGCSADRVAGLSSFFNSQFVTAFQGPALLARNREMTALLMSRVIQPKISKAEAHGRQWFTVDAEKWTFDQIFTVGVCTVMGSAFPALAASPLVRTIDAYFPMLVLGLPRWIIPKAFQARDDLAKLIMGFHKATGLRDYDPKSGAPPPAGVTPYAIERFTGLRSHGFTPEEIAPQDILIVWALHTNTHPTLLWTFLNIVAHRDAYEAVRREVDGMCKAWKAAGKDGQWWEHADTLTASLDSLKNLTSSMWEALRLYNGTSAMREATRDSSLTVTHADGSVREHKVLKGEQVFLLATHHLDPAVFQDPSAFQYDRFLPLADGSARQFKMKDGTHINPPVQTFGGGVHMCPGRFLAQNEVRLFIALMIRHFDIELADSNASLPGPDKSRIGIGMLTPTKDVQLRMRVRDDCAA